MMGQMTPMFIISLVLAVSTLTILIGLSSYASSVLSGINFWVSSSSIAMKGMIMQGERTANPYEIWVEWK